MKTVIRITAKQAAEAYDFTVSAANPQTVNIVGAAGADVIDIQYWDGDSFEDCYREGGQVQLSATNNQITVYGPGLFRINKGITTATIGASISTEQG